LITANLDAFKIDASVRDVGIVNKYRINADGNDFEITFTSNFVVSFQTFNTETKTLQFNIDAIHEKENVAEIIIPLDLFDGEFTILLNGEEIPVEVNKTNRSSVITVEFDGKGKYILDVTATSYLGIELPKPNGGGCLIATAAFGSELSPQVQFLREIRQHSLAQHS
jgi:hypothetical protein